MIAAICYQVWVYYETSKNRISFFKKIFKSLNVVIINQYEILTKILFDLDMET